MAQVVLLFKKTNVTLGSIVLDASLKETHLAEVETTDFPVEVGVDITDHARPKPRRVTIEGLVTNTPIGTNLDPVSNTLPDGSSFTSQGQIIPGLAETAYADLINLYETGELITVSTALAVYENMLLERLEVPRDWTMQQSLFFTASFKQVTEAQSQTVQVKVLEKKAQKTANVGKKPTTPATEQQAKSALAALADKTGISRIVDLQPKP